MPRDPETFHEALRFCAENKRNDVWAQLGYLHIKIEEELEREIIKITWGPLHDNPQAQMRRIK